ncbi:nucleoside triphosphate pyrophosphohydrolase [Pseudalkalibacillus berkeleyi]|uniref:Nucleoside triphosphate pyrophosphohydrolase n=1 Tax=Pseudalkalibacillus berkeleyi TaxID=1069813 RepID=A0ABS9GUL2_9BACL|nr:nucleoside triphosphate pyrophosphohydrolase [Pseudalkalibacillus berkeleyi]MCF6136528.1 nucleoside triphosphate pyrophosphohydrolase [Pseudalkalibacillus berkeleyi]
MPTYNKLVRDRIPEIIQYTGKSFNTSILDVDHYEMELKEKLKEELNEYLEASDDASAIEELADLLELIHALTSVHHSSVEELETVRKEKAEKRGGFQERIFLIDVEDE